MAVIQANRCLFQVMQDGVYTTVMCTRNFRVNPSTVEKEITHPTDGKFKAFDYSQLTGTVNVDGVLVRDPTTQTLFSFPEAQLNFLELDIRVIFIDELGNPKVFRAQCIVSNAAMEASAGNVGSGSVELLIAGEYFIEDALPEFVNLRIIIFNAPGDDGFLKFWLIDNTGQPVFQTDVLPQAVGGQLSNPLDITVPVPKGSWYYWFQFQSNNIGNTLDLDAPPTRNFSFNNGIYNEGSYPTLTYDFTADRVLSVEMGVNSPPPICVPPALQQGLLGPTIPVGVPWTGQVILSGSTPFTLSNIIKPSWLSISVAGNIVTLSGNPVAGLNQPISFDATNACGSMNFTDNIDVTSNPNAVNIHYFYTESGTFSVINALEIYINSVLFDRVRDNGSGSTIVTAGDVIEVRLIGAGGTAITKHIDITGTVDGVIFNADSHLATFRTGFTTVLGNDYTINTSAIG